jgi:hypothetical protein
MSCLRVADPALEELLAGGRLLEEEEALREREDE